MGEPAAEEVAPLDAVRRPRRLSVSSVGSRESARSTVSGLRVTGDGKIIETGIASDGNAVEDTTLTALFLSGRFSQFATQDTNTTLDPESEERVSAELAFFPDPPCVLPCDEDEEDGNAEGAGVQDYWKNYATWLDCWPGVKEARERNAAFIQSLSGGRARTSSIISFRVFANVSAAALGVRSSPTQDESAKTGEIIHAGQMVSVRAMEEHDGVRYWSLRDNSGWIFESKDGVPVLVEATNVETGKWWYRVACKECVEVRSAPTYSTEARTGWIMCPQELAVVILRCRLGSAQFLLLGDGRGWAFTFKPILGERGNVRAGPENALEECESDFLKVNQQMDFRNIVPPTNEVVEVGTWSYVVQQRPVLCLGTKQHGTFLSPGDIIRVDKRATASGERYRSPELIDRVWLRLQDGRGWVPVHGDDGYEQVRSQDPDDLTYPAWFGGNKNMDRPAHEWMTGFA